MRTGWNWKRMLASALSVAFGISASASLALAAPEASAPVQKPISERFKDAKVSESPDFQKHISPLLGRLGCNGRSCHGSFQGRGGFQLSLFGYDFQLDHKAMTQGEKPRVDLKDPLKSLIIAKPTDENFHEGGERYKAGSWQFHVFRRWIENGANYEQGKIVKLKRLDITPSEIVSPKSGEKLQMKAVAVWADGTREDVTPLCRFQSNDDQVCKIDENGLVTTTDPGDTHIVVFYDNAVVPIPVIRPVSFQTGAKFPKVEIKTKVDELVVEKLRKIGMVPSAVCTDAEFLRRVSLDLTGTLPSAADVEAFLENKSPTKRADKVNELLETPAYAAWWTTKLCDYTGNSSSQLNNVGTIRGTPVQEWYDWINKRVAANVPYDQIVEGIVTAVSRDPGESYLDYCKSMSAVYSGNSDAKFADRHYMPYFWARRNLRTEEERAIGFAYTFMGVRIQCAQCHKHPFDTWSKDDFDQFKKFFSTVKAANQASTAPDAKQEYAKLIEELGLKDLKGNNNDRQKKLAELAKEGKVIPFGETYVEPVRYTARKGQPEPALKTARLLGSDTVDLGAHEDIRKPLMNWLRAKDNPYFARAFVNRTWASYFNIGIVQPPDDMSLANPPSNKPLLDYLTQSFIEHNFDMKWLHREICNSATYQRSWQTNETNAKDEKNFSRSVPRRLPAEVAYDAIQLACASDSRAAGALTNLKDRSIALAGASVRDGTGNDKSFALTVFGRSIRESNCDCDRSNEASLLQTVFMQNDNNVLAAINGARDTWTEQLLKAVNAKEATDQPERIETRLSELRKEAAEVREKNRGRYKELTREIAELQARLDRVKKEKENVSATSKVPKPDANYVIRQAYLRTLSRLPTADEKARCEEYLAAAPSLTEGAKGLLWALINTKEFIVNH